MSPQSRTRFELCGGHDRSFRGREAIGSRGRASRFAGAPITQLEYVRLLVLTFLRLPAQTFYVKKAVVSAVAQMVPNYAAGRRRSGEAPGTV